jgi:hypothetical protein
MSGPPADRDQIARRRSALIAGCALVALLLVAGLIALLSGGDEGDATDTQPAPADVPRVDERGASANRSIGASIRRPRGWAATRRADVLALRSPDRTAVLTVSSDPSRRSAAAALRSGIRAVRSEYESVRPVPGGSGRIDNKQTASVVLEGVNRRGTRARILVAGVQGRRRAWLVQVFAAAGTRRLAEAQVALTTLELSG